MQFMTLREKETLGRSIGIQKRKLEVMNFLRDNNA